MRLRRALLFASVLGSIIVVTRSSDAHFQLQAPPSWMSQDSLGSPQKLGPCGDEDDGTDAATPTGIVTAYKVGDTITVTIDEEIYHPGHYRIALAVNNRSELPPEPAVDAGGGYPCGTAVIENPPVFPVLADNVFPHNAPFSAPQTTTVTLPSNVTCSHCTLQVIQFMSDHGFNNPGGCFYHHCADISVGVDAGAPPTDSGAQNDSGAGAEPSEPPSGCGCSVPSRSVSGSFASIALACALLARRRKRH